MMMEAIFYDNATTGGAAFPSTGNLGLSARDWFAGQALVGMLASPELLVIVTSGSILDGTVVDRLAQRGYSVADAMLKARGPKEMK